LLSALVFGTALGDAVAGQRSSPRDSMAHPWSAHLRAGGIVVDLGRRSAHKHILGGAVSGWGKDLREGDLTYSSVIGPRAVVVVDAFPEEVGDGTIVMAIRAGAADAGVVSLNGVEVGWFEASREHFELVELLVDHGIVSGPNEIVIEPEKSHTTTESDCPAFDVDFLRLVPGSAESVHGPNGSPPGLAGEDGLEICRGCSLTFNAVLDRASRLVAVAFASPSAVAAGLEIAVRTDPGNVARRARFELGSSPREVSLPLEDLAGQAVSVTLEASGGPVKVTRTALLATEPLPHEGRLPWARNLLVVLVDTLRADRLKVYNPHTRVRTPSISRFARSAVVFERAMAAESWTKPSVASLLTGLYPDRHKVLSHSSALPPTAPFAAEVFDSQGFTTAAFMGNGYISREYGFGRGWDTWMAFDGTRGANTARRIVDSAIHWLQRRPTDERFFAYVHTVDPHAPYAAPMAHRFMYVQRRYAGFLRPASTVQVLRDHSAGRVALSSRDLRLIEDLYDAEVTYNDHHVGRLLDALDGSGLGAQTLVVFVADHGEEFLEHAGLGHGHSAFEELVHVPLLVRLPGGVVRGRSAVEAGLTDVLPTVCDLLEVECPGRIDGRSFVEVLLDPGRSRGGVSFTAAHGAGLRAVRSSTFKLICRGTDCSLYDLGLDPGETTDVSAAHPIATAALRDALGEHLGRVRRLEAGSAIEADRADPIDVEANEEIRRQLVALGYLDN
jgi:arylsulfatase A-like enzyme